MFQKDMHISFLLDFYGDLLSDSKREALDLYYNEDLSLAEISDQMSISRQGVRDAVKKGEAQLIEFENKLNLAERFSDVKKDITKLAEEINQVANTIKDEEQIKKLKEVVDNLNNISI